jgi:hypothetical protein
MPPFCRAGPYSRLQDRPLKTMPFRLCRALYRQGRQLTPADLTLNLLDTATVILTLSTFSAITSHSDRPGSRRMSTQWQAFSRCPQVNGCRSDQLRYSPPLDVVQVRPNGVQIPTKRCSGGPNAVISPGSCLILATKPWGDTSPCSKSNLTWTRKHSSNRARDLDVPF